MKRARLSRIATSRPEVVNVAPMSRSKGRLPGISSIDGFAAVEQQIRGTCKSPQTSRSSKHARSRAVITDDEVAVATNKACQLAPCTAFSMTPSAHKSALLLSKAEGGRASWWARSKGRGGSEGTVHCCHAFTNSGRTHGLSVETSRCCSQSVSTASCPQHPLPPPLLPLRPAVSARASSSDSCSTPRLHCPRVPASRRRTSRPLLALLLRH